MSHPITAKLSLRKIQLVTQIQTGCLQKKTILLHRHLETQTTFIVDYSQIIDFDSNHEHAHVQVLMYLPYRYPVIGCSIIKFDYVRAAVSFNKIL